MAEYVKVVPTKPRLDAGMGGNDPPSMGCRETATLVQDLAGPNEYDTLKLEPEAEYALGIVLEDTS